MDPLFKSLNEEYHEPPETLSSGAKDIHRALNSLIEELQAVDWYHQRWEKTNDVSLKEIVKHNRDEEIEHAAMALEWLRREMPEFDEALKEYLFKDKKIVDH